MSTYEPTVISNKSGNLEYEPHRDGIWIVVHDRQSICSVGLSRDETIRFARDILRIVGEL